MDYIHKYILFRSSSVMHEVRGREEWCLTIAEQTARLISTLTGLVDETSSPRIKQFLTWIDSNKKRKTTINQADKNQRSEILNKLQISKTFTSNVIMELSNLNLYVISYTDDPKNFNGFIFIDLPVHMPADEEKTANINYIEIIPAYRNSTLAKKLIKWTKDTALENGYISLYTESLLPNETFWMKCGFRPRKMLAHQLDLDKPYTGIAICDVNPMSINNIIN